MPSPIGYQAFCPVGAALNAVGERWALLIVRDLLLGPRRYSELLTGLGGIGTDILAARLRTLQEQGVVRQTGEGRTRRYELTDAGHALEPVLTELANWGAPRVKLPDDLGEIPPRVPLTSLLLGVERYPRQAAGVFELRVGDETIRVQVADGRLTGAPDGEPTVVVNLTRSALKGLILGMSPSQLEAQGDLSLEGDVRRGRAMLNALHSPPLLAELRPQFDSAS